MGRKAWRLGLLKLLGNPQHFTDRGDTIDRMLQRAHDERIKAWLRIGQLYKF